MASPLLIAGLGNPGAKYADTPHNAGFRVVDFLREHWRAPSYSVKFQGEFTSAEVTGVGKVHLLKPQTFMNLSGVSVAEAARFFKIPTDSQLLVVYDEMDLPLGSLRLRPHGSPGGHNGMKSIIQHLGNQDFCRVRMGVGRSATRAPDAHLLSPIPKKDRDAFEEMVVDAGRAAEYWAREGMTPAMNKFNSRRKEES